MFGREECTYRLICDGRKTRARDEVGQPICDDCSLQREINAEQRYGCPLHRVPMAKEVIDGIVIDRCPEGCVFLDPDELEQLAESAHSGGFTTGLCLGVAT